MARTMLIRRVPFRASHRYWRSDLTDEENLRAFGETAARHDHEFVLEVEVTGTPDPVTGFVVDLGALDGSLGELVHPLRGQDLNEAIPEVREGSMQPSTESLAHWFWRELERRLPGGVRVTRIRVEEAPDLAAEVRVD